MLFRSIGGARIDVDAGATGASAGDRSVFRSPIRLGDGTGGTVYGVTTTVRTPAELAPDGVAGRSIYPMSAPTISPRENTPTA